MSIEKRAESIMVCMANIYNTGGVIQKDDYIFINKQIEEIKKEAADVQHEKISKWCPPLMGQGKCDTYCERCHGKIMRNSTGIFEETPYCPHCGADMRGDNL